MPIRQQNKLNPNFNMSSLTDIIFLLLIFFMLTSTLVAPSAIKVLLPSSTSQTLAQQSVRLTVDAQEKYYVDDNQVAFADLQSTLKTIVADNTDATVVLNADKRLTVETMVKVMSLVKELNVKMIIATKPS